MNINDSELLNDSDAISEECIDALPSESVINNGMSNSDVDINNESKKNSEDANNRNNINNKTDCSLLLDQCHLASFKFNGKRFYIHGIPSHNIDEIHSRSSSNFTCKATSSPLDDSHAFPANYNSNYSKDEKKECASEFQLGADAIYAISKSGAFHLTNKSSHILPTVMSLSSCSISPVDVRLQSYSFNQDSSCFVCATSAGFRVFTCSPLHEFCRLESPNWGIGSYDVAVMLFRTNVFAVVASKEKKKVKLWDDQRKRFIGELRCRHQVINVCMGRDILAIVTEYQVYVYHSEQMHPYSIINTGYNPRGLCVVSSGMERDRWKIACPAISAGAVRVEGGAAVGSAALGQQVGDIFGGVDGRSETTIGKGTTARGLDNIGLKGVMKAGAHVDKAGGGPVNGWGDGGFVFEAHGRALGALGLSRSGELVATASEVGTLVRVFAASDGRLLHQLRRGIYARPVSCLAFRPDAFFLAAVSASNTLHIFRLSPPPTDSQSFRDTSCKLPDSENDEEKDHIVSSSRYSRCKNTIISTNICADVAINTIHGDHDNDNSGIHGNRITNTILQRSMDERVDLSTFDSNSSRIYELTDTSSSELCIGHSSSFFDDGCTDSISDNMQTIFHEVRNDGDNDKTNTNLPDSITDYSQYRDSIAHVHENPETSRKYTQDIQLNAGRRKNVSESHIPLGNHGIQSVNIPVESYTSGQEQRELLNISKASKECPVSRAKFPLTKRKSHTYSIEQSIFNVGRDLTSAVYDTSKEVVQDVLKGVLPRYFMSARSIAQIHIPDGNKQSMDMRADNSLIVGPLCAFAGERSNHLYVLHYNGLFYEFRFDPNNAANECTLLTTTSWFSPRPDFKIQSNLGAESFPSQLGEGHDGDDWQII